MKLLLYLLLLLLSGTKYLTALVVPFVIDEESSIGTTVGTLDSKNPISVDSYFTISPTNGIITVSSKIDRDNDPKLCNKATPDTSCIHEIIVQYNGNNFLSVEIRIKDINDHSPSWTIPFIEVFYPEDNPIPATKVISPSATDPDEGTNSVQSYSLEPASEFFRVEFTKDPSSGIVIPKIIVQKKLDRELQANFNFTLIAEDGGGRKGSVPLIVHVTDVNDESPHFTNSLYKGTVKEDAKKGHQILTVLAKDKDEGANGNVSYSLAAETVINFKTALGIDKYGGHIFVNDPSAIDYETIQKLQFYVVATDGGVTPNEARAQVIIDIEDTNDNIPEIKLWGVSKITVRENVVNASVAKFYVEDKDAGAAGDFECSMSEAKQYFELTKINKLDKRVIYSLSTLRALDREEYKTYYPSVTCTDKGEPPMTSSLTISVDVEDENDSPPVFPGNAYFQVYFFENNAPGARVVNVTAVDKDSGDNARLDYSITWLNTQGENPFEIDTQGTIRARVSLDRETHPGGYSFYVVATDRVHSATATISVILEDVNDNTPLFLRPSYLFHVKESDSSGLHVGEVLAKDIDYKANGELRYLIHKDDKSVPFQLPADHHILYTSRSIDREAQNKFMFRIVAEDGGIPARTGTTSVTVIIDDVNDNSPVFIFPSPSGGSEVKLSYREPPDTKFTDVSATDADEGPNAKINYALIQDIYQRFRIDSDTGAVFVKKSLSRSEMGPVKLTVRASDGGSPPRSTTEQLTVVIDDSPPTAQLKDAWSADMETNKLIIICIVVATGVICAVLITAICLMARKQPCSPSQITHELVQSSPKGMLKTISPGETKNSYSLPLVDRVYDSRFGQPKFDTFLQPVPSTMPYETPLLQNAAGKDESDSVPESDGDSGKGGSVSNSNPPRNGVSSSASDSITQSSTLSFTGGRLPPDLTRTQTLGRPPSRYSNSSLPPTTGQPPSLSYHYPTLQPRSKTPSVIFEQSAGSLV